MKHEGLRELEHLVLLAMTRLEGPVHGVPIIGELRKTVGRQISRASVYVVLRRLEARGLVSSALGDPTPQRGGRAKRLYALTPPAVRALKAAQRDFVKLWAGSRVLGTILLALALGTVPARAAAPATQSTAPSLSGRWLNIDDPNAVDAETAAHLPDALLTIVHDGVRFDLTRSWSNAPIKESHLCDGRENRNGYSIVVERTVCQWNAAERALTVEGSIGRADGTVTGRMRYRYSLDDDGRMVVERMREITSAAISPGGPRSWTRRYRRTPTTDEVGR